MNLTPFVDIQLKRLLSRPGINLPMAQSILAAQTDRIARLAIADDVIDNSGKLSELDAAVAALLRRYTALASDVA